MSRGLPPESLTLVRTAAVLRLVSSAMRKRGGFRALSDPAYHLRKVNQVLGYDVGGPGFSAHCN